MGNQQKTPIKADREKVWGPFFTSWLIFLPVLAQAAGADNSQIPCPCAKVTDSQYPGPAAQIGTKILVNLSRAKSFDQPGFNLAKFHECQHSIGGGDEQQADAQGAKLACKAGYLTEAAVQNICKALGGSKGDGKHPPGPVRCQTFKKALQECKSGGGGGGSGGGGGGGGCEGGGPFTPPNLANQQGSSSPGSSANDFPSSEASGRTAESPDDHNPFKTGNYEKQARLEEEKASGQSEETLAVNGRSPQSISDITRSASQGEKSGLTGDQGGFESPRARAASAAAGNIGFGSGSLGTGNGTGISGDGIGGSRLPTSDAGTSNAEVISGRKSKSEILSSYKEPLSSPKNTVAGSEVAAALKAFGLEGAGATAANKEEESIFDRCHATYRRLMAAGQLR